MERRVSATEARIHFGELMQSVVREQNPVIVEKSGKPQIVLLSIEHYNRLQQNKAQSWLDQLEQTHALIGATRNGDVSPHPADVVRAMREERDAQLLDLP